MFIAGKFVDIMKQCNADKNYTNIDNAIREKITPYLYNGGKGKMVPCSEIVHVRNCIRNGNPVVPPGAKTERNLSRSKLDKSMYCHHVVHNLQLTLSLRDVSSKSV